MQYDHEFEPNEALTVQRAGRSAGGGLTWLAKSIASEEAGVFRFIASTDDEDRHGDIIEQGSWRLNHHKANPVFLYEHGHTDGEAVIGRADTSLVGPEGGEHLELSVRFHEHPLNINAILAKDQHETGFRNTVSVGFMPGVTISRAALPEEDPRMVKGDEWTTGRLYRYNELLEASSVGVPSLRQALQQRAYMAEAEDPEEQVRRYLKEAHSPKLRGFILDAIKADDELRKSVQLMILGTPRAPATTKTAALPWLKS